MSIILITLKDDSQISLDNRKKIKQEIKKYCGDIPDITDIAKEDRCERYTNYVGKFIDLTECEFEVVNSNTECCVFCNERIHKISDNCYCAVKKSRKFYVCPKCYNDFKSFLRFKIKK